MNTSQICRVMKFTIFYRFHSIGLYDFINKKTSSRFLHFIYLNYEFSRHFSNFVLFLVLGYVLKLYKIFKMKKILSEIITIEIILKWNYDSNFCNGLSKIYHNYLYMIGILACLKIYFRDKTRTIITYLRVLKLPNVVWIFLVLSKLEQSWIVNINWFNQNFIPVFSVLYNRI